MSAIARYFECRMHSSLHIHELKPPWLLSLFYLLVHVDTLSSLKTLKLSNVHVSLIKLSNKNTENRPSSEA